MKSTLLIMFLVAFHLLCITRLEALDDTIMLNKPEIKSISLPRDWQKGNVSSFNPSIGYALYYTSTKYGDIEIRYQNLSPSEIEILNKLLTEPSHPFSPTECQRLNETSFSWLSKDKFKSIHLNSEQVIVSDGASSGNIIVTTAKGCSRVGKYAYFLLRPSKQGVLYLHYSAAIKNPDIWNGIIQSIKWD